MTRKNQKKSQKKGRKPIISQTINNNLKSMITPMIPKQMSKMMITKKIKKKITNSTKPKTINLDLIQKEATRLKRRVRRKKAKNLKIPTERKVLKPKMMINKAKKPVKKVHPLFKMKINKK